MHLIEIFLPITNNAGGAVPAGEFVRLRDLLTQRFGGATFFSRAPAEGTWKAGDGAAERDLIVVMEVMTESVETVWWAGLKVDLEERLSQSSIVIRSSEVTLL